MVLRVQIVDLKKVVIDVLDTDFGFDTIQLHRLERQHGQRAGRILGQGLINPQRERRANFASTAQAMAFDQLLSEVRGHGARLYRSPPRHFRGAKELGGPLARGPGCAARPTKPRPL